jgi:anti-sigma regulatory factor (Ser/Thr protein kinase)
MPSTQERGLVPVGETAIPSGPEAPFHARTIVSRWLEGNTDTELHEHARLLVSELVTNSVMHAEQPAGTPVRVRAAAVHGVIRVEVEDQGHGPVRRRAPDPRGGGFGLYLLDQLATRWRVNHHHSTCVWFELTHHEPAGA